MRRPYETMVFVIRKISGNTPAASPYKTMIIVIREIDRPIRGNMRRPYETMVIVIREISGQYAATCGAPTRPW